MKQNDPPRRLRPAKSTVAILIALPLVGFGVISWVGAQGNAESNGQQTEIERGRYLVHHVAHCVACHTPRDPRGNLRRDRLLEGAPIPVASPYQAMEWAFEAPRLAGLANYDEQEVAYLLQHGERPSGYTPRPPMPSFRMTQADAQAVVAYLSSL